MVPNPGHADVFYAARVLFLLQCVILCDEKYLTGIRKHDLLTLSVSVAVENCRLQLNEERQI